MAEDVLHWLLPEADVEERARLRRVVTALRLMRDDARAGSRPLVSPWARAVTELEAAQRRLRRRAIEGVLHAILESLRSAESFLELGPSPMAYDEAWRTLLDPPEATRSGLPPAPGDSPAKVVERLLVAGEAHGAPRAWREYQEACHRHLAGDAARAERRWSGLFARAEETGAPPPYLARLLAGRVAARLEQARPRRAWELYARHAPLVASDPGLRRLLGWSALLCGELPHARELLAPLPAARLPRALLDLRDDQPEWGHLLRLESVGRGRARRRVTPGPGTSSVSPDLARRKLGAELLAVFLRAPNGAVRVLALAAPAAVRRALAERLREEAIEAPRRGPCRRRATGQADLPEALAGPGIQALARHVWIDARGAVAGWVQVECRHQLLPSQATLAELASAARARDPRAAAQGRGLTSRRGEGPVRSELEVPGSVRAEFTTRLFSELVRSARASGDLPRGRWRAAWVEPDGEGFLLRAEHGARGSRLAEVAPALREACAQRAPVSDRVGQGRAGSGLESERHVLPLVDRLRGCVLGVLVLEVPAGSRAHSPALEGLVRRGDACLRRLEPLWQATRFRAAFRALEGLELAWDPTWRRLAALEPALGSLLESPAIPLVVGAPGSGRRTLARWLHFRGVGAGELLERGASDAGAGGTRIAALESLDRVAQVRLARDDAGPGRWLLLARAPAEALRGRLAPELARRLSSSPLLVPELRTRRDEIPGLVEVLLRRAAREESLAPARLTDEALALLWRQDWRGQITEVEAFARTLVRARQALGRILGAEVVREILRSHGIAPRARLPSRRPSDLDLELALDTTRHRSGAENRARAARYLGWHPATLAARLRDRASEAAAGPSALLE